MATDDAMDVEASQGPTYGMDVEGVVMPLGPVPAAASDSIRDARNVVATFLRDHRAEDIVPVNSRVVVIDSAVRLRQAFKALLENGQFPFHAFFTFNLLPTVSHNRHVSNHCAIFVVPHRTNP